MSICACVRACVRACAEAALRCRTCSETLKVRDSSRKRRFSVGTKPARKMLMPSLQSVRSVQHAQPA